MTEQSFYRWKAKYGGMELSDMKRLKDLKAENAKLEKIVAKQALEKTGSSFSLKKTPEQTAETDRGGSCLLKEACRSGLRRNSSDFPDRHAIMIQSRMT